MASRTSLKTGNKIFQNIKDLPTFHHVLQRKSNAHAKSRLSLYEANVQSLYKAFQLKNNRLAWQVYEKMCHAGLANQLHPEDHTRMLGIANQHIIPSLAAAHVTRIKYLMKQCNIKLDYRDYHAILLVHHVNRDLKKVVSIFEEMMNELPLDGRSTSIVMACFAHYKDLSSVRNVWEILLSIPGALDSPDVLSSAIDSFGRAGDFSKASSLFQEYLKNSKNVSPLPFEAMIRTFGTVGQIQEAELLFKEMESKGILGLETFDVIIEILEPGNHFDMAIKYWDHLLLYCKTHNRSPLHSTLVLMMSFYHKQGQLEKVMKFFQKIESQFLPCAKEYEILVWAHLEAKDEVSAIRWFDTMVERGHHMSELCVNTITAVKKRRNVL